MNLSFHRMATVVTVALALLLGGCGSSETKPSAEETAEEIAMKAIMDAKDALTAAQAEVANATTDAEMLAAYRAVNAAAAAYVTALMANGGTAADIETATKAREQAMSMVTSLEEAKTIMDAEAKTIMDAKDALTAAQAEVANATTDAEMLAAYRAVNAAAAAYVTALMANGGTAADVETATVAREHAMSMVTSLETKIANAARNATMAAQNKMNAAAMKVAEAINAHQLSKQPGVEFSTLMITRGAGPGEIKLMQTKAEAKDKTFASSDANLDDNDWAGMAFTYTDPKDKDPMQSGTVFTDIEEGDDLAFVTYFNGSNHPLEVSNGVVSLTSPDIATDTADDFSGILPSGTPTAPDNKVLRNFEGGTVVPGSFYGVPGEYRCASGAVCTVGVDVSGTVTVDAGGLTFAPTIPSGKTLVDVMVKNVDADKDYLHFGYWMQSVEQRDGSMRHDIRTFSGGAMLYNAGQGIDAAAMLGAPTATYTGPAAGRYVKKSGFDPSGNNPTMVMDGTFTADAELIATFGAGTSVPAADHFTVKGDISNFMDGSTDLGWTLDLKRSASIETQSTFIGVTSGGGKEGEWNGTLYGDAALTYDHDYDNGTPGATAEVTYGPTGIAGQFNGHFTNGHVAGAFGATRD